MRIAGLGPNARRFWYFVTDMIKLAEAPSLTELAYDSIKQSILNGSFGEVAKLTEASLATQLGVSKSPVREALNRLEAEGLICIHARRGAHIRQFSMKEASDLYDLRELLELHSVNACVVTPKLLEQLGKSIERTKRHLKEGDKLSHIQEDLRFHSLITAATANDELLRVFENIQQKSLLCRSKTYDLSATTAPSAHTKIYDAFKSGKKKAAWAAMREHILFVRNRLLSSLDAADLGL